MINSRFHYTVVSAVCCLTTYYYSDTESLIQVLILLGRGRMFLNNLYVDLLFNTLGRRANRLLYIVTVTISNHFMLI